MNHIIPVINATSFAEVQRKITLLEPHAEWVHIDVADGSFTQSVLWHDPTELGQIKTTLFLELHLMLDHIDDRIADWLQSNVHRAITHIEAMRDASAVIARCHGVGIEIGIALKPETPCVNVAPYVAASDLIQILAVTPGPSGQVFQESMIDKIAELRHMAPMSVIEVDGGVNADVVKRASAAGANLFATGHALFTAPDIGNAIEELERNAQT